MEPQHHIGLRDGDVGRYVFVPGDPGRCERIADRFDSPRHVTTNREYNTWTGYLDGEQVAVTSTGIGCPSAVIALEELTRVGADTFVRVGTAGSMQEWIRPGSIGVATAAIRDEGTTSHYLPLEFPAVADLTLTAALADAAKRGSVPHHVGVVQSKDSFYGQHEPERMPVAGRLEERWAAWRAGGAICSEMEAAGLFIVASVLGVRAGGVMLIAGHPDQSPMSEEEAKLVDLDPLLDVAVAGMRQVIAQDRELA